MKKQKVFLVQDDSDARQNGDVVRIEECRPLSKLKHFRIIEVLREVETFVDPTTGNKLTKYSPGSALGLKRTSSSS
jgi:small subunit ribosomal protein S17